MTDKERKDMSEFDSGQYILEGKVPVKSPGLLAWAKWFQTANRHVAKSKFGKTEVSTVFLGLDHSFGGCKPLLFETMVFGGPMNQEMDRYSTWEEAEQGHKEMCDKVKKALGSKGESK